MSSENFTDYLDPTLVPLEERVQQYLDVEKEIRETEIEIQTLKAELPEEKQEAEGLEPKQPQSHVNTGLSEKQNRLNGLLHQKEHLKNQIIEMLPVKEEFVKVDLGYGPSTVGCFTVQDPLSNTTQYELRIVH